LTERAFHEWQIALTLPEEVLRRAELLARRTGRALPELLTDTIALSLQPLGTVVVLPDEPQTWSDAAVQAEGELEMPPADDARLSVLLDRQQPGILVGLEQAELTGLCNYIRACCCGKRRLYKKP
jgi:hypothetical protein